MEMVDLRFEFIKSGSKLYLLDSFCPTVNSVLFQRLDSKLFQILYDSA